MLKVIGFLLEFKNKASEGIKKVIKDTEALDKTWKTGAKNLERFTKATSLQFDTMKAEFLEFFRDTSQEMHTFDGKMKILEESLGDRAAGIAQAFTAPRIAMAAVTGMAFKAGSDYEKIMRTIKLETGGASEVIEEMGEGIQELAFELGTGLGQVANVTGLMAKRMVLGGEASLEMASTIMRASRVSQESVESIASGAILLQAQFGVTADEFHEIARGVVAIGQNSRASLQEMFAGLDTVSTAILKLPSGIQKKVIPQLLQMQGVLADTFVDAPEVMNTLLTAMTDVSSEEFGKMNFIFARGGSDAMEAFRTGIETGDITTAFEQLLKSIGAMDLDQQKRIATAMKDVLGFDITTLDKLSKIDPSRVQDMALAYAAAAKNSEFLVEQDKQNLTITQRLWQLWSRTQAVLIPIGEILIDVAHAIVSIVTPIVKLVKWLLDIPIVGDIIKWGVALSMIGFMVIGIAAGFQMIIGLLPSIGAMILSSFVAPLKMAATALTWIFSTALPLIIGGVKALFAFLIPVVTSLVTALGALIAPFIPIIVIVTAIAAAIAGIVALVVYWEDVTWGLGKAWNWIGDIVKNVGKWLQLYIIDPILFILGALGDIGSEIFHAVTFGFFKEDEKGMAEGGIVHPSPGGTKVRVAEAGEAEVISPLSSLSQFMGTDEIVAAVWGAAELIVDAMNRPNTAPSAARQTSPGGRNLQWMTNASYVK